MCQPEELLETADVGVEVFVGERVFGQVIPFQEAIGLETVEAEDLPEVMNESALPFGTG